MYNPTQKISNFKSRKGKLMAKFMREKRPQLQSSVQGFLPQLSQEETNSQMFLVCDSFLLYYFYFKNLCGGGVLWACGCVFLSTHIVARAPYQVSPLSYFTLLQWDRPLTDPKAHKWEQGLAGGCEHSRAAYLQPSMLGLQEHATIPSFLCDDWNLNSGPHTCRTNTIAS